MCKTVYTARELEILEAAARFSTATVHEAMGRTGAVDSRIRPLHRGRRLCGFALTVQGHPKDNLALHNAIYLAQPWEVIAATVDGYAEAGYWGDVMTTAAMARGVRGLAFDGGVRDSREIGASGFPVYCAGACIKGTEKNVAGAFNRPILLGGQAVNPGDLVLGDDDGLVVIPRGRLEELCERVAARMEKEEEICSRLRNGGSTLDIYGLKRAEGL